MKASTLFCDDTSGTGQWRMLFPANLLMPHLSRHSEMITITKSAPVNPNFLAANNSVMIQRFPSDAQRKLFEEAIFPASALGMTNIIYNTDDVTGIGDIPKYNPSHWLYDKQSSQDNIKAVITRCDYVLVTTAKLKEYVKELYGIPENNFLIVPNMLPRSLFWRLYQPEYRLNSFTNNKDKKGKLNIGLIGSSSHLNTQGFLWTKDKHECVHPKQGGKFVNPVTNEEFDREDLEFIPDDFDLVLDTIRATQDKYNWIVMGEARTDSFRKAKEEKLFNVIPHQDILHFFDLLQSLNLDVIVAPSEDSIFSQCKSNLKVLEAASIGAALFVSDVLPYQKDVPEARRFKTSEELTKKLLDFYDTKPLEYMEIIDNEQYSILNSPVEVDDGPTLKNYWLDDNLSVWRDIFFPPRKGLKVFIPSLLTEKKEPEEKTGQDINE